MVPKDIYSWNVEQAGGQMQVAHNIVDVVIRTKGLNVQDAFDYVGSIYRRICAGLLDDLKNLPSFEGPYNDVLKFYVEGLVEWVQGNVEFSLASGRYFGHLAGSQQIRATGIVEVLPPKSDGKILSYWMKSYLAYFYSWKKALAAPV
jgi:Delta6-protoilludene synthase